MKETNEFDVMLALHKEGSVFNVVRLIEQKEKSRTARVVVCVVGLVIIALSAITALAQ